MKFLLGKKVNMTQIFDDKGLVHPATVLQAGPMTVVQVKTVETDGYNAIQVGFGVKNAKNINKAVKGHTKEGNFEVLKEWRMDDVSAYKVGDVITPAFEVGDTVTLSSVTKGKGFQGGVKRHGFKGGPRSHGQKHSEREPGSLGGGGRDGGRVAKGKRMAGRMGSDRVTSKGLTIVSVNTDTNEVFVRGAVSGKRGTLVEVVSQ